MTATDRTERVIRVIEATVAGDSSAATELFTPDVVAWSPSVAVGSLIELSVEMEDHEDAFSEVEVVVGAAVATDDRVCAEWIATVLHSGPLTLAGCECVAPTGRRLVVRGATVAAFTGDRICAVRHYWDEVGLLRALGLLTA